MGRMHVGLAMVVSMLVTERPAEANPLRSRLTPIDLAECTSLEVGAGARGWRCPGLPGYPVLIVQRKGGFALSFGANGELLQSARQSVSAANAIFEPGVRPAIEWRMERLGGGRERPFATIVRFHARTGDGPVELLVITKVATGVSCQLAIVEASSRTDAMALARSWADQNARKSGCPAGPERL